MGEFKPFKVTTNKRYWEDEDFGILVKKGREFTIYPKHLRSYMLKFSIVRGDVQLVKDEKTIFAFKGRIMSIVGGDNKNLITIIGENGKKVNKKLETKSSLQAVKDFKESKKSPEEKKEEPIVIKEEPVVEKVSKPKSNSKKAQEKVTFEEEMPPEELEMVSEFKEHLDS